VVKNALQGLSGISAIVSRIAAGDSSYDGNAIPCRQCLTRPKRKKLDDERLSKDGACTANRSLFSVQKFDTFKLCLDLALPV
jgi:hypothetical protein